MDYEQEEYDHLFKLLVIGNSGVGKSCMLMRYVVQIFLQKLIMLRIILSQIIFLIQLEWISQSMDLFIFNYLEIKNNLTQSIQLTIPTFYIFSGIQLDKIDFKLLPEVIISKFLKSFTKIIRGAHGIMIVYDITDQTSFESVKQWLYEIECYGQEKVNLLLIGNKQDLQKQREVTYQQGAELGQSMNLRFIETSAKEAINTKLAFESLALDIMARVASQSQELPFKQGLKLNQNNRVKPKYQTNRIDDSLCGC